MGPLISIVTVSFNSEKTIERTLKSVAAQTYKNVEHIVIDGASKDGTVALISRHLGAIAYFRSEPDAGLYDALNKGLQIAKGDIIGLMHSDDVYADDGVLFEIAAQFERGGVDGVYGDAAFFRSYSPEKTVRLYSSAKFSPARLSWGWMPAHTTLYLRSAVYKRLGLFKTDYAIAADFDFICRVFLQPDLRICYVPKVLVKMQTGGTSTSGLMATIRLNREVLRACWENGLPTNIFKILSKYPAKFLELWSR
jgi:glycosyltransferase involved in cell wall biosynthesis